MVGTPDYTTERMLEVLRLLRHRYHFNGYIHAKAIPGASPELIAQLGCLADRLSVNIELPSEGSLKRLAPDKGRSSILRPMGQIAAAAAASRQEVALYRHAPAFAPAGQSTQMIVGATPESDYQILRLTQGLYQKYNLKRVFFSAYIPVAEGQPSARPGDQAPLAAGTPAVPGRLAAAVLSLPGGGDPGRRQPQFQPLPGPQVRLALRHLEQFPVDVNRAPYEMLLRVPGIGVKSAQRIRTARRQSALGLDELKRMGVVLKRAQYFIVCRGFTGARGGCGSQRRQQIAQALVDPQVFNGGCEQLSLFSAPAVQQLAAGGMQPRLAGRLVQEEAVRCLAKAL